MSNLLLTTATTKQVSEFGDPSVLKPVPSPLPTCSPGEVLVSLRAAGVNPVETYIRSGKYAKLPTLPFTPGEHIPQGSTVCRWLPPAHTHTSPPPPLAPPQSCPVHGMKQAGRKFIRSVSLEQQRQAEFALSNVMSSQLCCLPLHTAPVHSTRDARAPPQNPQSNIFSVPPCQVARVRVMCNQWARASQGSRWASECTSQAARLDRTHSLSCARSRPSFLCPTM